MQNPQEKSFGKLLREFREKSYDRRAEKRLSQERLAILLTKETGIFINRNKVGEWERGKKSISQDDRITLTALITILHECGGINTVYEANHLLETGLYLTLTKEEKASINPEWLPEGEIEEKFDETAESRNVQEDFAQIIKRENPLSMLNDERLSVEFVKPVKIELHDGPHPGSAPPIPSLIVGREKDIWNLKETLSVLRNKALESPVQILTAIRGWPGVGKTTIASAIAYDPELAAEYEDGVLWVSLGQNPNLLSEIAIWGRAMGTEELLYARSLEEASAQLRALLRYRRTLLIIDDVWKAEHAIPFIVGGHNCATLITSRLRKVADELAPTPENVYYLPVLPDDKALDLLKALAPSVISQYPTEALELVQGLEGLPLALQVAGRLLNVEASYGFGVKELISELKEGVNLLEALAPADRMDVANETTPTIAVLLDKSVERLDQATKDCYAYLGVFAPKPATFDLAAMKAVWQLDDPVPIARSLVDRGLLEYIPDLERYQMHALLVSHAKSLFTE